MKRPSKKFYEAIDSLSLKAVMLDPGDIPKLGEVLNELESVIGMASKLGYPPLLELLTVMKQYIEKVILAEENDLSPIENAISVIQQMERDIKNGVEPKVDISETLASLGVQSESSPPSGKKKARKSSRNDKREKKQQRNNKEDNPPQFTKEDLEIIQDFVMESMDNLSSIEVRIMDLEQDPSDLEIINSIFRPFHTIKGVSGFLNFKKINNLSHIAETLLDKARNAELNIDAEIIDILLASVDTLKGMIKNIEETLKKGSPDEGDIDPSELIERVKDILSHVDSKGKKPIGEILVKKNVVKEDELKEALEHQRQEPEKKIGEILVEKEKAKAEDVVHALREQKRFETPAPLHVKVDISKLDNIVDMVGELAIAQSMLKQNELIVDNGDRKLYHIINQLNQITSGLQRTAMGLRMVPIKNTFQKMLRIVRDLSRKSGKQVSLIMSGEDTEIDRNMVEEIYEPMVHMIRNAIDHGLETPEEREAKGKPREGRIYLKAYHKGGNIIIEISDDGRGLNREKILKKAISLGLVKEEEKLTESEIDNLIFHPGFSTAEKVTDISGRGVGTDVVKNKIEKLRGRVDVESEPDKGTTFYLKLPLTLAIVDGMIIKVAGERYIIPTLSIQESFKPKKEDYYTVEGKGEMIKVRDTLIPLIRLDKLFGLNGNNRRTEDETDISDGLVVVVENQEKRTGILIDELLGQDEIVIKSLGGWLKDVKGLAGGAIMGDGRVGLILDIAGIVNLAFGDV